MRGMPRSRLSSSATLLPSVAALAVRLERVSSGRIPKQMGAGAWTPSRLVRRHRRCPRAQRGGSLRGRRRRPGRRRVHDPPGADERPHPRARCARRARGLGDPRLRPRRRRRLVAATGEPVRDPDGAGRDGLVPVDALLGQPRDSVHDRHHVRPRSRPWCSSTSFSRSRTGAWSGRSSAPSSASGM